MYKIDNISIPARSFCPGSRCLQPVPGEFLPTLGHVPSQRSAALYPGHFLQPVAHKPDGCKNPLQKNRSARDSLSSFAEGEGFEPPNPLRSTVFKTAAINHSANPPSR